jgi:GMP synthase-like glutamine amidotransferase
LYEDHGDEVHTLPEGFIKVASSNNCDIEMMASKCGRFFSMQAHP